MTTLDPLNANCSDDANEINESFAGEADANRIPGGSIISITPPWRRKRKRKGHNVRKMTRGGGEKGMDMHNSTYDSSSLQVEIEISMKSLHYTHAIY